MPECDTDVGIALRQRPSRCLRSRPDPLRGAIDEFRRQPVEQDGIGDFTREPAHAGTERRDDQFAREYRPEHLRPLTDAFERAASCPRTDPQAQSLDRQVEFPDTFGDPLWRPARER
ncbi:hypothetical protein HRbin27_01318 [bacterium HR27]|nr:hypothetical protein HRbin27_01318 [bacterium HR27]